LGWVAKEQRGGERIEGGVDESCAGGGKRSRGRKKPGISECARERKEEEGKQGKDRNKA